jgi:hypothetical protein
MACHWMNSPQGVRKLECVLLDRLAHARSCGDCVKAGRIESALGHFCISPPGASAREQDAR